MQSLQSYGLQRAFLNPLNTGVICARHASLTSAISRGLRKGANTIDRIGTTRRTQDKEARFEPQRPTTPRSRLEIERFERPKPHPKRWGREKDSRDPVSHEAPQGVPFTTAGSEFIYGTFAVKAALEARRRRLHKLYIWKGDESERDKYDESISRLARSKQVRTLGVAGSWDKMLMKMSGQRPHNGYVLEASPIPKLPIAALEKVDGPGGNLAATVLPQSTEDEITNRIFQIDGSTAVIPRSKRPHRYPLLLYLDRVTDTGNLGAIIRSAVFFGIDAIIIPEHGTAPFGPITVKASAGAAEYLPILTVRKELEFVQKSKEKGWKFFAAIAPDSPSTRAYGRKQRLSDPAAEALDDNPCVLMLGNEGEGLRGFMQKAADVPISIEGVPNASGVVDSLNVSVAAALLMTRFFAPGGKPLSKQLDEGSVGA